MKIASSRKERRVIVIADSLLRGIEGLIFQPDPTHREVCCLPGAQVRDISRKLPSLNCPFDYYLLLMVQAGSDEVTDRNLRTIKNDFRGLGRLVDEAGIQVVICLYSCSGREGQPNDQENPSHEHRAERLVQMQAFWVL